MYLSHRVWVKPCNNWFSWNRSDKLDKDENKVTLIYIQPAEGKIALLMDSGSSGYIWVHTTSTPALITNQVRIRIHLSVLTLNTRTVSCGFQHNTRDEGNYRSTAWIRMWSISSKSRLSGVSEELFSAGESECQFTETPVLLGHRASHLGNRGNTAPFALNSEWAENEDTHSDRLINPLTHAPYLLCPLSLSSTAVLIHNEGSAL